MVLNEGVHELVEFAAEAVNIHVVRVASDAVYWDVRAEVCLPVYEGLGWAVYLDWVANEKVPRSKMKGYIRKMTR